MKSSRGQRAAPTLASGFALALFAATALAQAPVTVTDAWVRAAPPGAEVLGGYLVLHNHTREPIALIGVSSLQFKRVELHQSAVVDGVARMQPVTEVVIPARGSIALAPGGLHLMLIDPVGAVSVGNDIELVLALDNGWTIETAAPVQRADDAPHRH